MASDRHRTAEYRIREGQSGLFGKARTRRWPSIDEQIALAAELRMIDPESDFIRRSMKRAMMATRTARYSGSPTARRLAYSMHIQELGPTPLSNDLIPARRRFRACSRIARCEVRYNREKVLLVEICYSLGHQRAPFSRSRAVLEVIELPEHVAR
jgi:hypothetical protein